MQVTKDDLRSADLKTLFTHNPATFFEAVLINILWDKTPASINHEVIARQRLVFDSWFNHFETSLRADIEKELKLIKHAGITQFDLGFLRGQIHAIKNLPFKDGTFGKSVDLKKLAEILRQLKALEPVGVKTNDNQPTAPVHQT